MFSDRCLLVGMVHLAPLPGSPGYAGDVRSIYEHAERDADALAEGGCDVLLVENMGDLPYLKGTADPETIASMAIATERVVARGLPTGVQVLAGANEAALGVAVAAGARFIRAEAFAYAHVADEGLLEASAGPLLRRRRALGADVLVLADIQKKHASHALTADLDLAALAKGSVFCGADGVIVTGASTGASTSRADVEAAKAGGVPVLVGSGVTDRDAASLAEVADGLIVGSWIKQGGDWRRPVDVERVKKLVGAMR